MSSVKKLAKRHSCAAQVIGIAIMSAVLAFLTTNMPSVLHIIWMLPVPLIVGAVLNRTDGCLMIVLLPCVSLTMIVLVRSVSSYEPPAEPLAREEGLAYQTIIRRWDDPHLLLRPFDLAVKLDSDPRMRNDILFAEQCEGVTVVQTATFLYVFYHEMALTRFGSFRYRSDEPKPVLCDLSVPICAAEKDRLTTRGAKAINVCPSRSPHTNGALEAR